MDLHNQGSNRAALLIVVTIAGFVSLHFARGPVDVGWALGASACFGLAVAAFFASQRMGLHEAFLLIPCALYYSMVFMLENAVPAQVVISPMVLAPVVLFALSSGIRTVMAACLLALVTLAAPILLIGEPAYSSAEWGRVMLWAAVLPGLGTLIHQLVSSLRAQTEIDALTGAANASSFRDRLGEAVARASRMRTPVSVALIDLDHFKTINDSRGHAYGDDVLRSACEAFRSCLRASDSLGRIGGEEFAVVCDGADLEGARVLAERLRAALQGPVTCSVGVAEWDWRESPDQLMIRADQAMYRAKAAGRNRVEADYGSPLDALAASLESVPGLADPSGSVRAAPAGRFVAGPPPQPDAGPVISRGSDLPAPDS